MSRALQNEAEWIPDDLSALPAALERMRAHLFDAGHTSPVVNGITGWLFAKAIGEGDQTNSATRARYRRILRELEVSPVDDDPKRSTRTHRVGSEPPIIIVTSS